MHKKRLVTAAAIVAAAALALAGCSSGGSDAKDGKVTINWWHIQTTGPSKATWQKAADAYEKKHPNVTIKINVQDGGDAFKNSLQARLQAGDPPDLFQTWGGGVLAEQVKTGLVKDITSDVKPWIGELAKGAVSVDQVDGKQYGVPYNTGLTGFWYNKAAFAKAGISEPPTTWDAFLDDVKKLKAAGITPIALGEGDKWPGMAFWEFGALRYGGQDAINAAAKSGDFTTKPFIQAGELVQELTKMQPFQDGFLGAKQNEPGGSAALVGSGQAGMELMGQWDGGTIASVANDPKIASSLGWFEFPTVPGGKGTMDEGFGGVDGFAVGKNAPPQTIDFLKYLSSTEVQDKVAVDGLLLPTNPKSADKIKDPILQQILKTAGTKKTQVSWFDQFYSPAVANAITSNVQGLYAGTQTPEQVAQAVTAAAKQ